jgi:hypothetical protein
MIGGIIRYMRLCRWHWLVALLTTDCGGVATSPASPSPAPLSMSPAQASPSPACIGRALTPASDVQAAIKNACTHHILLRPRHLPRVGPNTKIGAMCWTEAVGRPS